MTLLLRLPLLLVVLIGFAPSAQAAFVQKQEVRLASQEWPPFSGEALPQGGLTAARVRAAFEAMGYQVTIDYLPWYRAMKAMRSKEGYAGVFPAYADDLPEGLFIRSPAIGESPLVVAGYDIKLAWNSLDDLKNYMIGIVQNNQSRPNIEAIIKEHLLLTEKCVDDVTNLYKLKAGRIDLAIIDKNVMSYYLESDDSLKTVKAHYVFSDRIIDNKPLFIGFAPDEEGEKLKAVFTEGLRRVTTGTDTSPPP